MLIGSFHLETLKMRRFCPQWAWIAFVSHVVLERVFRA